MVGKQEDITLIRKLGINVDDDNEDVVENMPVTGEVILHTKRKLLWDGVYQQKKYNFKIRVLQ